MLTFYNGYGTKSWKLEDSNQMKRVLVFTLALIMCFFMVSCASKKKPRMDTKSCDKSNGFYKFGISYFASNDATSALGQLLKAEELCPHDPKIQDALGLVYYSKERFPKAIEHFQKALKWDPNFSNAAHNLGIVYLYLNRYDEAIALFQNALSNDLYRNRANSINALGWAYYKKKDYEMAEKYFKETLEHNRLFYEAYGNLAKVYLSLDRVDDAIDQLSKVLQLYKFYPEAHLDLAKCYIKKGQSQDAVEHLKKVLSIDPLGPLGTQAQKLLNLLEDGNGRGSQ